MEIYKKGVRPEGLSRFFENFNFFVPYIAYAMRVAKKLKFSKNSAQRRRVNGVSPP